MPALASSTEARDREAIKQYLSNEYSNGWCEASTRRLLTKIIHHKPFGIAKHFHMMCLVDLMNHIYEDEQDIAFEEYLTEENLNLLKQRRASTSGYDSKEVQNSLMVFSPSYKIRPTAQQIEQKLNEFYGVDLIDKNELTPEPFFKSSNFKLPKSYETSALAPKEPSASTSSKNKPVAERQRIKFN